MSSSTSLVLLEVGGCRKQFFAGVGPSASIKWEKQLRGPDPDAPIPNMGLKPREQLRSSLQSIKQRLEKSF